MKKIILIGSVACGKTTLMQRLNDLKLQYKKTQAIEVFQSTIDTPGEYLENKGLFRSLMITATEAEQVIFVQDASRDLCYFAPGQACAFSMPVAGVVSKIDIASERQIHNARELLLLAGASPILEVSAVTGDGMEELQAFLESRPEEKIR